MSSTIMVTICAVGGACGFYMSGVLSEQDRPGGAGIFALLGALLFVAGLAYAYLIGVGK